MTDMLDIKDLHEAAKKLYKEKGHVFLAGNKNDINLVAGPGGVHGAIGDIIFGNNMTSVDGRLLDWVARTLKDQGYLNACLAPEEDN